MSDPNDLQSSHSAELGSFINDQAHQTNADVARSYTSGNSTARGLLNQPENFNEGLSYGDRAQSDAIKAKYAQGYAHKESELNNKMLQNADADHIRKVQNAADMAGQEVELNKQKEILRWRKQQASKAARGAVLGNVLGIAAGAVTTVATGGNVAAGLAAYQGGQAAGNAYGSAN